MGVSMGKTGRSEVSDINITPMIDVLLVLLVIFMVAQTTLMKAVDVQLPKDQPNQEQQQDPDNIILEIDPGPVYHVNTKPVPAPELKSFLQQVYTGRPKRVIFIKADGKVKYQQVIEAEDMARGAGVKVIGQVLPT
jgi:biopolymer transport protein ExbD